MQTLRYVIIIGALIASVMGRSGVSHAANSDDARDDYIVFGRGDALWRTDWRGKATVELAKLPAGVVASQVTRLAADANGETLLAEAGSHWYWLPLRDSSPALRLLPCAAGPAELAPDGKWVVCNNKEHRAQRIVLATGKVTSLGLGGGYWRVVQGESGPALIWADGNGVWRAGLDNPKRVVQLSILAPLRHFLVAPDGTRALGVFVGKTHQGKKLVEEPMLHSFTLDGSQAKRKAIKHGQPLAWSHDANWALVQDRTGACLMRVVGGQYKCWTGYVAASLSGDGRWALVLGNREDAPVRPKGKGKSSQKAGRDGKSVDGGLAKGQRGKGQAGKPTGKTDTAASSANASPPSDKSPAGSNDIATESANRTGGEEGVGGEEGAGGNEESGQIDDELVDDEQMEEVAQPGGAGPALVLPAGPHHLYRADVNGAFTDPPVLLQRLVEGAAVWVSSSAVPVKPPTVPERVLPVPGRVLPAPGPSEGQAGVKRASSER